MEARLLARLSAALVLFLTVAAMLVLSSLTVNAQKGGFAASPLSSAERKTVEARARQVFRDDIVKGGNRDAKDADLTKWLMKMAGKTYLEYKNLEPIIEKLGNGFGAQVPRYFGVAFVLPDAKGLGEFYIFAVAGSDFEVLNAQLRANGNPAVGEYIVIDSEYEPRLRRRMDTDSLGTVSEDEFANYVVTYFAYKSVTMR